MNQIRKINSLQKAKNISLTAIDGAGLDNWQKSKYYEKRINETFFKRNKLFKIDILNIRTICKLHEKLIFLKNKFY